MRINIKMQINIKKALEVIFKGKKVRIKDENVSVHVKQLTGRDMVFLGELNSAYPVTAKRSGTGITVWVNMQEDNEVHTKKFLDAHPEYKMH